MHVCNGCTCVSVRVFFTYVCACMHSCVRVCVHVRVSACMYACNVCMYVMYVCRVIDCNVMCWFVLSCNVSRYVMYACVRLHVCTHVCMHLCSVFNFGSVMCACMYVCM